MDKTIHIGLSNQMALRRRMDILAHNVANMNTTGFKKEKVAFREYLMKAEGTNAMGRGGVSHVLDFGIVRDLSEGQVQQTWKDLDIAIKGKGYLAVDIYPDQPGVQIGYTRYGSMKVDNEGYLALQSGERVLGDNNQPIIIDEEEVDFSISKDGTLSSSVGDKGRLGIWAFTNEQNMERVGNLVYRTEEQPEDPFADGYYAETGNKVDVVQGHLEGSNVNGLVAMTDMVQLVKSYETITRQLDKYQKMRSDSLDRLARVQ